jgi:uncharacterized membrane protein (DUF106 family)
MGVSANFKFRPVLVTLYLIVAFFAELGHYKGKHACMINPHVIYFFIPLLVGFSEPTLLNFKWIVGYVVERCIDYSGRILALVIYETP